VVFVGVEGYEKRQKKTKREKKNNSMQKSAVESNLLGNSLWVE
jgi:hypothetical protein